MTQHTDTREVEAPFWRPSADSARTMMLYAGFAVAIIGAIALGLSFVSIDRAARPFFGGASWAIPVLMDTTIGALVALSLVAELNGLRAPLARYAGRALVALTVYANTAPQHGLYAKILHGAPPTVWVVVVAVAEGLVRRLARLNDKREIEPVRRSLWLLRPVGTWRIWRQQRIHQITTYAAALDRDAARAAVVGRLRVNHGRLWRHKAPLGDRIALRLQGRDPQGVAEILTAHADTAALLAAPAGHSQEAAEGAPEPSEDRALMPLDPIVYPAGERPVLAPFSAPNALGFSFAPTIKALPSTRVPQPSQNGSQNAQEAQICASTENDEEDERDAAVRMRREGASFQQIADRLGRSKSWVHGVVTAEPVEHANGHSAA